MEFRIPKSVDLTKTNFWCPGCGHGIVARITAEAIEAVGERENTILVEDVACGHFQTPVLEYNNLNTAHGRTMVAAEGIKRAMPGYIVISHSGDGASYSIGMESTINCALRNQNFLAIVTNNTVFGMTGGQMSPATMEGQKTTSSPKGRNFAVQGHTFDVVKTLRSFDIAYLARGTISTPAAIVKTEKMLEKALRKQQEGKGFCLVEILSPCPTNWHMDPPEAMAFMRENLEKQLELGEFIDK